MAAQSKPPSERAVVVPAPGAPRAEARGVRVDASCGIYASPLVPPGRRPGLPKRADLSAPRGPYRVWVGREEHLQHLGIQRRIRKAGRGGVRVLRQRRVPRRIRGGPADIIAEYKK